MKEKIKERNSENRRIVELEKNKFFKELFRYLKKNKIKIRKKLKIKINKKEEKNKNKNTLILLNKPI